MLQASDRGNIHVNIVGVDDAFLHIDGWDFGAVNANHGRSLLGVSTSSGQTDLTVKNSKYDGNGAFTSLMDTSGTGKANITLQNCDFYAPNSATLGLSGVMATLDSNRITVKKTIASTAHLIMTNNVITILEGGTDTVIGMSGNVPGSLQTIQSNVFIGPGGANKLMNYNVDGGTIGLSTTVQNNIITGFGTVFDGPKAYAPDHNILWQNTTVYAGSASDGGDNITADPDLDEDGRPGDESPAWGAGAITGLDHDIVGNARPYPGDGTESIGAYEREYVAPPDPEPEPPKPPVPVPVGPVIYASTPEGLEIGGFPIFDATPTLDGERALIQAIAQALFSDVGWWADAYRGDRIGSRLHELYGAAIRPELGRMLAMRAKDALAWLTAEGYAKDLSVEVELDGESASITIAIDVIKGRRLVLTVPELSGIIGGM
jgi:phage gp46-like protein